MTLTSLPTGVPTEIPLSFDMQESETYGWSERIPEQLNGKRLKQVQKFSLFELVNVDLSGTHCVILFDYGWDDPSVWLESSHVKTVEQLPFYDQDDSRYPSYRFITEAHQNEHYDELTQNYTFSGSKDVFVAVYKQR